MLREDNYRAVAQLHSENITNGFLTSLGVPFLTLLYEAIDASKNGALLVEIVDDTVVGFVSGASGMRPIYGQLMMRLPRVIRALLPSLLSPSRIYKILEILLLAKENKFSIELPHDELLSIVVAPSHQGQGIADKLFTELCVYFKENNIKGFRIIVGESLLRAQKFYLKMGSEAVGKIEVHKGEASIVYLKSLN